jgi:hypothetical protein
MINRFIPIHKHLRQIALGLILFFFALIVLVSTSAYKISQAEHRLDQMANSLTTKLATLDAMISIMKDIDLYTRNIILESDKKDMQNEFVKILTARGVYDNAESQLDALFISSEDQAQLKRIKELRAMTRPLLNHAIELGMKNQDQAATTILIKETVPLIEERLTILDRLRTHQIDTIILAKEEASSAHTQASILVAILGIVLAGTSLAVIVLTVLLFISIGVLQTYGDQSDGS